jgi:hypothetical protein
MSEGPGLAGDLIAEVIAQGQTSPAWLTAGFVLVAVLVWGAFEWGLAAALHKTIRALRARLRGPDDPS